MEIQLIVKKGKTSAEHLTVRRFPTLVGRHRECNVRIAARQVSRRHCVLKARDGWLFVCDLDSCNGTIVNGRPIRGEVVLHPGDMLEIGPVLFTIDYETPVQDYDQFAASDTIRVTQTQMDVGYASQSAYELSERLSEIEEQKAHDSLDTHHAAGELGPSGDSGSKIIVVDSNVDAGISPTRRIFSKELVERSSAAPKGR